MMSLSPIVALRQAISVRLKSQQILTSSGIMKVFDEAPRDAAFPYATWGDVQARSMTSDEQTPFEIYQTLTLWSQARGTRNILELSSLIFSLLDDANLVLSGFNFVSLRVIGSETKREQNGRLARVNLRLRAVVE